MISWLQFSLIHILHVINEHVIVARILKFNIYCVTDMYFRTGRSSTCKESYYRSIKYHILLIIYFN